MADSRQQIYNFIDQAITDPLNRQNTAEVVRAVLKYIVQHSANLADDGGLFNTPEGVEWTVKPTLQVSGNTLTVSEAEADWSGVTVLYPETSFTLATPASGLERLDTVYANQNGTYGVDAGPEGESAVAEQPPVGTLLAGFVLVGAAGGEVQPQAVPVDYTPVALTDATTVTYNTYQNGKVRPNAALTLAATPLLQTLVIANTQIGYAYQVRIKGCSGQNVTISPISGVSYLGITGEVLTTVALPGEGDCILTYYHASSSERVIEVLDGNGNGGNFVPLSNPQGVATTVAATLNPGEMELLTQFASGKRAYLYGIESASLILVNSPALLNAVASALYTSDGTRDITAAAVIADGVPVFRISMFDILLQQTTYFDFGFDGKLYVNGVEFSGGSSGASWGGITGNLSDQTDLSTALSLKVDKAIDRTIANSGPVTLTLDKDAFIKMTGGQLTGNLTLSFAGGVKGVEQVLTFEGNGSATVTINGATLEGFGVFRSALGTVNKLWVRCGQDKAGNLQYFYLWG